MRIESSTQNAHVPLHVALLAYELTILKTRSSLMKTDFMGWQYYFSKFGLFYSELSLLFKSYNRIESSTQNAHVSLSVAHLAYELTILKTRSPLCENRFYGVGVLFFQNLAYSALNYLCRSHYRTSFIFNTILMIYNCVLKVQHRMHTFLYPLPIWLMNWQF